MVASAAPQPMSQGYFAIPLSGLAAQDALTFPLYLRTAEQAWVLYRPATAKLDASQVGRLQAEGIAQLFIRNADRGLYFSRVGDALDEILLERGVPLEARVDVLQGIATQMAESLLAAPPDRAGIAKARKVMIATSGLMLRENGGFSAMRRMMSGSKELAHHSLTVGFLCMGLARNMLGADSNALMTAGLAGLLHDVGKIGHESTGSDPEHVMRGADYLQGLGLPEPVVEAARLHHERWDGSGFPYGLSGVQVPEVARVVAVVNTFDKVYSGQRPRVGVFDALRILAQAYRGCFEPKLAAGLISLFR
ncbi:MAG: HD domain-containing protein [Planctomycetes bacterium]|nr:HD domain-containing protein [Planctomycetota bacterium]